MHAKHLEQRLVLSSFSISVAISNAFMMSCSELQYLCGWCLYLIIRSLIILVPDNLFFFLKRVSVYVWRRERMDQHNYTYYWPTAYGLEPINAKNRASKSSHADCCSRVQLKLAGCLFGRLRASKRVGRWVMISLNFNTLLRNT